MRINEILVEAAVWKSNRVPQAPAASSPAGIQKPAAAPKTPTGPGAFRKGLFKMTGLGNQNVQSAVVKDNFIKKFAAQYNTVASDDTGAFNPKDYLDSIIDQNNWGPLTTQQQLALDSATRTQDANKIATVMYQIGTQNRSGSSVANKKAMPGMKSNQVKSTTGKPDDLSPGTSSIMSKIEMMANSGSVDDLEAICRDALNVLNKVSPSHYAAFVKQLVSGKKPAVTDHPADDNPNINLGSNE